MSSSASHNAAHEAVGARAEVNAVAVRGCCEPRRRSSTSGREGRAAVRFLENVEHARIGGDPLDIRIGAPGVLIAQVDPPARHASSFSSVGRAACALAAKPIEVVSGKSKTAKPFSRRSCAMRWVSESGFESGNRRSKNGLSITARGLMDWQMSMRPLPLTVSERACAGNVFWPGIYALIGCRKSRARARRFDRSATGAVGETMDAPSAADYVPLGVLRRT